MTQQVLSSIASEREDKFRQAYCIALRKAVLRNPTEYAYSADLVDSVVDKMIRAFKVRDARIEGASLAAIKSIGAPTRIVAFTAWLNGFD